MKIAPLSANDIDEAIRLARVNVSESRFTGLAFDADKVRANLERMAQAPQSYNCALVARKEDGTLVGYMAGQIEEYFFCRERVATSVFLFVDPKERGGLAAVKLILAFRRWAQNRGAAEMYIGVAGGVAVERTGRFLRRLGFTPTGGNYSQWLVGADSRDGGGRAAAASGTVAEATDAAVSVNRRQGQAR